MVGNSEANTFFNQFIDFVEDRQQNKKLELLEKHLIDYYKICININFHQGKTSKLNSDYEIIRLYNSKKNEEFDYYNDVLEVKDNLSETELVMGDVIYAITDGFHDRFGGEKGKKFKVKPFKNYLISIAHLPMQEQKERLNQKFTTWKGEEEQVDDVCVIGVKI